MPPSRGSPCSGWSNSCESRCLSLSLSWGRVTPAREQDDRRRTFKFRFKTDGGSHSLMTVLSEHLHLFTPLAGSRLVGGGARAGQAL